ncbi:hypothetical protein [Streptomyces sp. NPDC058701]|uniref:hypothetical protein n=1 Tax=Streptomyces sp. NPDC058701 TaxID=3346608 RepID=UPI003664DA82
MQLRRAVPLSLVALLASAGCVSVGPDSPAPATGSVPPVGAPDRPAAPSALPLGKLPGPAADEPRPVPDVSAGRPPAKAARPLSGRPAKPAAPRRAHPPGPASPHPRRKPTGPPAMDELCAAADGTVPPSIVDLCLREYGR